MMKYLSVIVFLVISANIYSQRDKSIYGVDNRRLVRSLEESKSQDQTILNYSSSMFAQIPTWRITDNSNNRIGIKTKSLKDGLKFCSDENFLEEPIISSCTAFLIAPNIIMTAGHCVKDKFDCKKQTWVLDYKNSGDESFQNEVISFPKENTFQCAELISKIENNKLDFALIKLDRAIDDRPILKIRKDGKIDNKESLLLLGFPLGMPMIASDQIFIRDNSQEFVFKTNADSFSGNSGSPLIGLNSGLVEGILIRGDDDFYMDEKAGCNRTYRCSDKDCRGETVLRSTVIPLKF